MFEGLSWLSVIVAGGIAGWLASIITRTNERMGCLLNIVVGVIGAVIGSWIFVALGGQDFRGAMSSGHFLRSILVAFVGATAFLLVLKAVSRR